jgi:hypothetical protein
LLIILLHFGCDNNFSPYGDYEKRLVVFSVLDNRFDNQIVKLQSSFEFQNSSSEEKIIYNLTATISDGLNVYQYYDTAIVSDNYTYLVSNNFTLRRGVEYTLNIKGDDVPEINSKIKVPESQYLFITYRDNNIQISHSKASRVKGFLIKYYVNFVIVRDAQILSEQSLEMPIGIIETEDGKKINLYPSFNKNVNHEYKLGYISAELAKHAPSSADQRLLIKNCTVVLFSLDDNLYNYLSTVNGFNDPISVRLDIPNYTNIQNGYGIFGAITKDSVVQDIPITVIRALGFESFNNSN